MAKKQQWIPIETYNELAPGSNYPSMRDSFAKQQYPEQKRVAAYLRNGTRFMASLALPRDAFTGQSISESTLVMHDDKYCWSSDLVYYIETYNLKLPAEIEQHILAQVG